MSRRCASCIGVSWRNVGESVAMSREPNPQAIPYPLLELAEQPETLSEVARLRAEFEAVSSDFSRHQQEQRLALGPELNAAERAAVVQLDRMWPAPPARLWRRWQRLLIPLGVVAPSELPGPVHLPQLLLLAAAASQQTSAAWALTRAPDLDAAVALRFALSTLHPVLRDRCVAMLDEASLPWCWRATLEQARLSECAELPIVATWVPSLRGRLVGLIFGEEPLPLSLERWLFEDLPAGTPAAERWNYLRMDQLVADDEALLVALLSPSDWMVEPSLMAAAAMRIEQPMEWLVELMRLPKDGQPPRLYDLLDATEELPPRSVDAEGVRGSFAAAAAVWAQLPTTTLLTATLEACEGSVPWDLTLALSLRSDLVPAILECIPDLEDYEIDARDWIAALRWAATPVPAALAARCEEAAAQPLSALLVSSATPAANPLAEKLRSPLSSYAAGMNRDLASSYGNDPSPIAPSTQPSIAVDSSDES